MFPQRRRPGYPDIAGDNWQASSVPAGTPKQIIAFLQGELVAIVKLPEVKERLAVLALNRLQALRMNSPSMSKSSSTSGPKVIKASNIKAD
jgi:tripartite-type tricarboxylate transporter receptor subunit TctC